VLNGLLRLQGFIKSLLCVPGAYKVVQLGPQRLPSDELDILVSDERRFIIDRPYLYPIFPLPVLIVSHQEERAYFVCYTGVSPKAGFHRSRLDGAFDNIPKLVLERLSRTFGDLRPESRSLPRITISQIDTCILALEKRGVQDVCARMLHRGQSRRFIRDLCKYVEVLKHLL
jgi:hypothetical protein